MQKVERIEEEQQGRVFAVGWVLLWRCDGSVHCCNIPSVYYAQCNHLCATFV